MKLFHRFKNEGEEIRMGISFMTVPSFKSRLAQDIAAVYFCIRGAGFIVIYFIKRSDKWRMSFKLCLDFLNHHVHRTFFRRFTLSS